MPNTFPEINIYDFAEITFIGGTPKSFTFIPKFSGSGIALSGNTGVWKLAPLAHQEYAILSASSIISGSSFTLKLSSTDTENLAGKYIQEVRIILIPSFLEYSIGRGIVNIEPRIGLEHHEHQ